MKRLREFAIVDTPISGTLSTKFKSMDSLRQIKMSETDVSGTIPPQFGRLDNLKELLLANSKLSGTIPEEIASLDKLKKITLYGNAFSGSIPEGFASLDTLEDCAFTEPGVTMSNVFTCPLPEGIPAHCAIECGTSFFSSPGVIAFIVLIGIVASAVLVCCAVRLRARYVRSKTKLLAEVTSCSSTVMNDLTDRKSGAPVVIVDGKSVAASSSAASHVDKETAGIQEVGAKGNGY